MVRRADENKIKKIMDVLKKHPEGTYISQISRETNLAKTTVSYLINTKLKDKIKEIISGDKGLFKIVKLKN
ncbi:helix-turn-helix domain-containing protein [Candidatus Woesearchaeota archaeon]|nr:helix-turn-helix domain-containing protein [Candidatus Woesearchaeota archaeon]